MKQTILNWINSSAILSKLFVRFTNSLKGEGIFLNGSAIRHNSIQIVGDNNRILNRGGVLCTKKYYKHKWEK